MCCPFLPSHCCKFLLRYYPLTVRPVLDLSPSSRMESVQGRYPPEVSLEAVRLIPYTVAANCSVNFPKDTSSNRISHGAVCAEALNLDARMAQSRRKFRIAVGVWIALQGCVLIRGCLTRQACAHFIKPIEYGNRVSIFHFNQLPATPTDFDRRSMRRTFVDMGNRA